MLSRDKEYGEGKYYKLGRDMLSRDIEYGQGKHCCHLPGGSSEDHRFRVREEGVRQNVDALRHARVPRTRDNPVQGTVVISYILSFLCKQ